MKKIMSAVLIAAMLGSLAACGSSKDAQEATTEAAGESLPEYVEVDIDAKEYVELGEYKNLKVKATTAKVSDEEVNEEIENLRYEYSTYEKVSDRKDVKEDDVVNVDYECTVDGNVVDDFTEAEMDITIGSGELVFGDAFDVESSLIGAKIGDTVKVEGTFPEDEMFGDVAGKKAEMKVTINYIEKEIIPEFDDDFVKENFSCDTAEEYRQMIYDDLMEQAQGAAEEENQNAIWEMVVANAKQIKDFPEDKIALEKQNVITSENEWASYFGLDVGETEEEQNQYFMETYEVSLDDYTKDSLFRNCVLNLLVEKENLSATDEEIDEQIKAEMEAGEYASEEEVLQYSSRENFAEQIVYNKVMDFLMENSTIE